MSAALIAATLTAIAAPTIVGTPAYGGLDTRMVAPWNSPALDRDRLGESCQTLAQKTADRFGARFKRLDQLPWGLVEHAVLRSVGGCPVREVVYQGQTYWIQPQPVVGLERVAPVSPRTGPTQK